jgi:hypothetical protein
MHAVVGEGMIDVTSKTIFELEGVRKSQGSF